MPSAITQTNGSAIRPRNATAEPLTPNQRLPRTIEALPVFGPGRNWHRPMVSAKSAGVSQRRSSTIVRCAHGMTPPNERAPMARKPMNSSLNFFGGVTSIFSCTIPHMRALMAALFFTLGGAHAQELPIFDAHLHYSHDAWDLVPVPDVLAILRKAGVRRALVSSAGDDGQQRLYAAAPDLIIPELRPYRSRADVGTWAHDETVVPYLEERLRRYRYAAIGEFHLYGGDADLPVPRRMVELARKYNLFLHAHSDIDAVERLFRQWPQARIL